VAATAEESGVEQFFAYALNSILWNSKAKTALDKITVPLPMH